MTPRQQFRQHSKSTLLKATETMMRQRDTIALVEARRWRKRLAWAVSAAFLAGGILGTIIGPALL